MSTDLMMRMYETCLDTRHEVRELRREVGEMSKRAGRTRGWTALPLSPKLLPWLVAAVLLASGHLGVGEIKTLIGLPGLR